MKHIYRKMAIGLLCLSLLGPSMVMAKRAMAPIPIVQVIKMAVTKVIKAMDLMVQRLQNKTIWLQNAQKVLENALSKLKLEEISEWTGRQKELYGDYYQELVKVKTAISHYRRIRETVKMQTGMVEEYERVWNLLRQDNHFTPDELDYMADVYSGMLEASLENIDEIFLVVKSLTAQMSDAKRLELINWAADQVEANYLDLKRFNQENMLLSLQRAKSDIEAGAIKRLYGITDQSL